MKKRPLLTLMLFLLSVAAMNAQSFRYCGTVDSVSSLPPDIYEDACGSDESIFRPDIYTDTIVVNVAIYALNKANGTGSLNNFADSTFEHWIDNVNYLYSHLQPAISNVTGTDYLPDTKIRFKLVGIYHPNVNIYSDGITGFAMPTNLHNDAINLILSPGVNGWGVHGGYGQAFPSSKNIHFLIDSSNIVDFNYSISHRYMWAGHELGHVLGLVHSGSISYSGSCNVADDWYDDTYYPDHMWGGWCSTYDSIFYRDANNVLHFCQMGVIPNNIMGYSACENYFSPKQIAHMRARLLRVIPEVCETPPVHPYCLEPNTETILDEGLTTYSGVHVMDGSIAIQEGNTLLITGCVYMPENAKILVAPGATLIVDGGTITTKCIDKLWGGIEVQGAYDKGQAYNGGSPYYDLQQGLCIIKNDAHIERANLGVFVGGTNNDMYWPNSTYDIKKGGGILRVDNSSFINCKRGIYFYPYKMAKKITRSYIHNSYFGANEYQPLYGPMEQLMTSNVARNVKFEYCVYLNGIAAVDISGNTFQMPETIVEIPDEPDFNTAPETERGTGIIALNSAIRVTGNHFNNLRFGIKASNNYTFYKAAIIKHNRFNMSLFGITGNLSFGKIDSNVFIIPQGLLDTVNIPAGSSKYPYGIYLENSHTFTLQTDTFMTDLLSVSTPPPTRDLPDLKSYGLIIKNSSGFGGEVKTANYFKGLQIATQTEENNPNLTIRCNKYDNNIISWRVNPLSTSGILGPQGSSCNTSPTDEYRANNSFLGCGSGKDLMESYVSTAFDYYYWNNNLSGNDDVFQPCTTSVNNNVTLNECNGGGFDPNTCSSAINYPALSGIRNSVLKNEADSIAETITLLQANQSGNAEIQKLLISYYYEEEDSVNLDYYLTNFEKNTEEDTWFQDLYIYLSALRYEGFELEDIPKNNTYLEGLEDIAVNPGPAGSYARALLEYLEESSNNIAPEVPGGSSARVFKKPETIKERGPELGQNVPNPSNTNTDIFVFVPEKTQNAELRIINSMGQLTMEKTLVKGEQRLNFALTDLAGGIYFYTLYVEDKPVATKRMAIVK